MTLRYFAFLLLSLGAFTSPALGDVAGKPTPIDGQTLEISGQTVRLSGISAPGLTQECVTRKGKQQQCGALALENLKKFMRGEIKCVGDEKDHAGRLLAVCYSGPIDINEYMVLDGWALAYPRDGNPYSRAEGFAKARREGLWRAKSYEPPWEWRKRKGE